MTKARATGPSGVCYPVVPSSIGQRYHIPFRRYPASTDDRSQTVYDVDKNSHANDARIRHSSRLCGDVRNASIVLPRVGACDAASYAADAGV